MKIKEDKLKKWKCDYCHIDIMVFVDYEPEHCCAGLSNQCCCMGEPINPMFCDDCEKKIYGAFIEEEK